MFDLNTITKPGVYHAPVVDVASTMPLAIGHMKQRDIGKYRLLEHTDDDGKVTNWQKELPDGEWKKVDSIRAI